MKQIIFSLVFCFFSLGIFAQINTKSTYVSGYYKSNGTYVNGYFRSQKNSTNWDNWSTTGNYNLLTNSKGTKARDYTPGAYKYGNGKNIYTGPRGGQYYINSKGNKTYVPKRNTTIQIYNFRK